MPCTGIGVISDRSPPNHPVVEPISPGHVGRVLIAVAIVGLAALAVLLRDVIVLAFGSVLVAVALRLAMAPVQRLTGWPERSVLAAVVAGGLLVTALGLWQLGEPLAAQFNALRSALPGALAAAMRWLNSHAVGLALIEWWDTAKNGVEWARVAGLAGSALGAVAAALLMLVLGVYLAADPALYRRGLVRLMPLAHRRRVEQALDCAHYGLSRWLLAQSIAMVGVGTMTAAGLALLGMPLALPLGIIAGLLGFVPFFGTMAAAALIVLLAFAQGVEQAFYAALVCLLVQQLEGYVLQPFVQRWAIALPPALGPLAVIVFGVLFGPIGAVVATPLMIVLMLMVQRLYVDGVIEAGQPAPRGDAIADPAPMPVGAQAP